MQYTMQYDFSKKETRLVVPEECKLRESSAQGSGVYHTEGSRFSLQNVALCHLSRCLPFFQLSYFLHDVPLIYAETSLVLHFGKKNKVSDNLLRQLLVLPVAKLQTACIKFVKGPTSLCSNLEQNQNIFGEGEIMRHLLWGSRDIK